jgi:hypothetical protein
LTWILNVRTVGCWKIQARGENLCGSGRGHHLFQIQRVWWWEEVKKCMNMIASTVCYILAPISTFLRSLASSQVR